MDQPGTHVSGPALPRRLGLGGAVAIGIGAMLGTGVFAAWTPALALAGPFLLASLALAACIAALNAWSTGALARIHPEAGGAYAYGRARIGRTAGAAAGWAFVIGKIASAGAAALTIGAYVWPEQQRLVGLAAIALLLLLDVRGVTRTALVSAIGSAVVIAVLMALVAQTAVEPAPAGNTTPGDGFPGAIAAAGLLFVAFAGYARIAILGEEVRDPVRTLPRAMIMSFGIVLVTYVAVATCVLTVLGPMPAEARSSAPLEQVATLESGSGLSAAVRVAAVIAAGGALLSLLAGVGRTLFAMGRGHDAPSALVAVSTHGIPYRAQLVAAAGAAGVVLMGGIGAALALSSASILTYYGVAHVAALRLPSGHGRPPTIIPIVGLVGCVTITITLVVVSVTR